MSKLLIKILAGMGLVMISSSVDAQDSEVVRQWLEIPPNQAAIAIYADWKAESPILIVSDTSKQLDRVNWQVGLPLVRQYRLEAGIYDIHFQGFADSKTIDLVPGQLAFLKLDISPGDRAFQPIFLTGDQTASIKSQAAEVIKALTLKEQIDLAKPIKLDPVGHALYFNTEPPFPIPGPPPEPVPEQK